MPLDVGCTPTFGWTTIQARIDIGSKPIAPRRICWGCDRYCAADSMACGNGSVRAQHPAELFGEDWHAWGLDAGSGEPTPATTPAGASARPGSGSPDR